MAKRRPAVRFEPPPGTDLPVLTSRGGRVRGELVLRNERPEAVSVPALRFRAHDELGTPLVETWQPPVLPPGEAGRASLSASLDRQTPPGTYAIELDLDGVVQRAVLRVAEDVSLTLSERELVVSGDADVEQTRTLLLTNRGNVPLLVRQIGPVDLEEDVPRPSLLERLGVLPPEDAPRGTLLQRMGVVGYVPPAGASTEERRTVICLAEGDDEPRPTLAARLLEAITIAPGEVAITEWIVTVDGPLRPGARYRASAPLYTADVAFVVTPSQAEPPQPRADPAPRARSRSAATTAASRPRAARSPSQKRRDT
jgi:hypothetical protein